MQIFIKDLPIDYSAAFIGNEAGATVVTEIEPGKYAFGFIDDGKEGQLDGVIENYETRYVAWGKVAFIDQIVARVGEEFLGGFTVPANKGGDLAGKVLQVRDVEDRTNWLTSQVAYSAAISAGAGALMGATFRTASNETVTCTYSQGAEALLAMAAWGAAIMNRSWVLKDAVLSATTSVELATAISGLNEGWPSSPVA
jgi:hypothetical protein